MDCLPQIHAVAIHANSEYRSDVLGLGVYCHITNTLNIAAGSYSNSVSKRSNYLMVGTTAYRQDNISYGYAGGVASGYSDENVVPMLGATVVAEGRYVNTHFYISPAPAFVQLSFTLNFR